ncbi:MAG: hypothetical protein JXA33_13660 [Anaerolineae bacterium]|nr:hypothetical protein [Anaerolineae bacterium]
MDIATRTRILRLLGGLLSIVILLGIILPLLPSWFHSWGATEVEVARSYPGDDILPVPVLFWTHTVTVDAPPEQVWPWIAQLGDRRGAFYSYTFIENLIAGEKLYVNADRILPEYQNPQPGTPLIDVMFVVRAVEPGHWMLGEGTEALGDIGWTWLWWVEPFGDGQSRFIVRGRIQAPAEMDSGRFIWLLDAGSFVMGRRMMEGLALRAEGRAEPPAVEALEIVLWTGALFAGLGAGICFLWRRPWQPLLVGIAAVLNLVWFTFGMPALWIRLLVDLVLWAVLVFLTHIYSK